MMHNNLDPSAGKPHLVMVIQPDNKSRFRYKSETGSHGVLLGRQEGKGRKKIHPTVKLENYYGNKDVSVRVSLYTEDKQPHVFEFVGPSDEDVPYITEPLQEDNTVVFSNIKFLSKKKDEICQLLLDRKMKQLKNSSRSVRARFEASKEVNEELKETAKTIMNSVRLCFEAFEDGNSERLCEPLFSDLISNQKAAARGELKIHRLSHVAGTWKGGDEVILLCDRVQKDNIKILFYDPGMDRDRTEYWEKEAIFTPADVHYQCAITFKTPRYKKNDEKQVYVCLARNDERSEPLQFTYRADFEGSPSKKRKNHEYQEPMSISSPESSSSSYIETAPPSASQQQQNGNLEDLGFDLDLKDLPLLDIDDLIADGLFDADNLLYPAESMRPPMLSNENLFTDTTDSVTMDSGYTFDRDSFDKFRKKYESSKHSQSYFHRVKEQMQHKLRSHLTKRDSFGNTYLHVAVYQNKNVAPILRMNELSNMDLINEKNNNQETALHIAVKKNNTRAVESLLKYGCNPNVKNAEGNNCYHIASLNNYCDVMECLLFWASPDLNVFNYEGLTPLHIAVMKSAFECYKLLTFNNADVNVLDQKAGRSLLHYAVEFQPSFILTLIKEGKLDVNIQDFEGNTPLHIACAAEKFDVVEQLLRASADPALKNFKRADNTLEEENNEEIGQAPADVTNNIEENNEEIGQTPADVTNNMEIQKILTSKCAVESEPDDTIEKLCSLLNENLKWKEVSIYFMDEKFICSLECSPNPAKALLLHIEKEKKSEFIKCLKQVLEITGPSEALEIVKEKDF